MGWSAVSVRELGDEGGALFPSLGDNLEVLPEPTDGSFESDFPASAIRVDRRVGDRWVTVVNADDVDITMFVTGGRVVFHSRKWNRGGGWIGFDLGGLAVAAAANAISKGVAAHKRKGKALTGHIRHEWLAQVGWAPKSFMIPALLSLKYRDGTETNAPVCRVILQFKGRVDTSAIARLIVDKAVAYWYASAEEFTPEQLSNWETLRTSGLLPLPARGSFAVYDPPKFYFVGEGETMRPKSAPRFPAAQRGV